MKLQLQCEKLQHEVDTIKSKSIDIETYEEEVYQRIISIKRFFTEVFMRNLHHYANKPINELRPLMTLLMRDAMNAYANSPQKPK